MEIQEATSKFLLFKRELNFYIKFEFKKNEKLKTIHISYFTQEENPTDYFINHQSTIAINPNKYERDKIYYT